MTRPGEHERRPFYACETCGIVYARFDRPDECDVCEGEAFVEVMPKELPY